MCLKQLLQEHMCLSDKTQKFYMNTFNSTTRPNEVFGISTMINKRIIFKDGNLTNAMKLKY